MAKHRHRVFLKGGITPSLNEDTLRSFFGKFGEVLDVYIPKDPMTQQLKGFAFVAFSDAEGVDAAVQENAYTVEGHLIPVTRADPRDESRAPRSTGPFPRGASSHEGAVGHRSAVGMGSSTLGGANGPSYSSSFMDPYSLAYFNQSAAPPAPYPPPHDGTPPLGYYDLPGARGRGGAGGGPLLPIRGGSAAAAAEEDNRIYVGGVPNEITQEDIRDHFEQYGTVVDVYFPKDRATGKRRTFCYVRFGRFEEADTACARSQRSIKGCDIFEIRIAQPKPGERSRFSPY